MKVTSKNIVFESQRESYIFQEILREVRLGEVKREIHGEVLAMLADIVEGLSIYDEEAPR